MTVPLAGVTLSAQQVAAQRLQQQGAGQQLKTGSSKFDGVMANKASGTQAASGVSAPSSVQKANMARAVEQTSRTDKARLDKVQVHQKVSERPSADLHADKTKDMLGAVLTKMAKGQNVMDGLIKAAVSGRHFSNAELLGLQAGVYKYTQEMELTGKVVEKATDGLQQTLKTQV